MYKRQALVSASPSDEHGETRENVVKTEIEDNDNDNLTIPQVVNRLGMVFFPVSYTHLDVYKRQIVRLAMI